MTIEILGNTGASIIRQAGVPMADGLMHLYLGQACSYYFIGCEFYTGDGLLNDSVAYGSITLSVDSYPRITNTWPLGGNKFAALVTGRFYDYNVGAEKSVAELVVGELDGDTVNNLGTEFYTGGTLPNSPPPYIPPRRNGREAPTAMLRRADGTANYLDRDGSAYLLAPGPVRGAQVLPPRVGAFWPITESWLPDDYYVDGNMGFDAGTSQTYSSPGRVPLDRGVSATFGGSLGMGGPGIGPDFVDSDFQDASLEIFTPTLAVVSVVQPDDPFENYWADGVWPTLQGGQLMLVVSVAEGGGTAFYASSYTVTGTRSSDWVYVGGIGGAT